MQKLSGLTILALSLVFITQGQQAAFNMPDSVCANSLITIENQTRGGSSFYWNFCSGNPGGIPKAKNYAYPVSQLSWPVYTEILKDGDNYYCFVSEHRRPVANLMGGLSRLDFGNSMSNIPKITQLGDLNGVLPYQTLGISIKKDGDEWIGYLVAGQGKSSILIRLDFGSNVQNIPVATNLGNIGNLKFPHDLQLVKEGRKWYGFTINTDDNSLTKFDFGNSLSNKPTGHNFGTLGNLKYPLGFYLISDQGSSSLFVPSVLNNTIVRFDFGNSVNNLPVAVNLGVISGLDKPTDITIVRDCSGVFGFSSNTNNSISRLDFGNSMLNSPTAVNLGNLGRLAYPHSISQIFRTGNSLNFFVPNVANGSLTEFSFQHCTSASISSSTEFNPPAFSFSNPGTYSISLYVDDGLTTQNVICKEVVVGPPLEINLGNDTAACNITNISLGNSVAPGLMYRWSTGDHTRTIPASQSGVYWLEVNNGFCRKSDTVSVIRKSQSFTMLEKTLCAGETFLGYSKTGIYRDTFPAINTCDSIRELHLQVNALPKGSLSKSNEINCVLGKSTLTASGGSFYQWAESSTLSSIAGEEVDAFPDSSTIYHVQIISQHGCSVEDSIEVLVDRSGPEKSLVLPNAFSPNGDGKNDCFGLKKNTVLKQFHLEVFSRWGQKVFSATETRQCWDGNQNGHAVPPGVYVYQLSGVSACGPVYRKGTVVLVR